MSFSDLSSEQARQTVDVEQVFAAYQDARTTFERRFMGAMSWKTVRGRSYLYRKRRERWESLGPRSPETESAYAHFHAGRADLQDRLSGLTDRLDGMAPVNRALQLGRLPQIAARILRALDKAGLIGHGLTVVGTNALFVYERLGGVQIASPYRAPGYAGLLFDARHSLRLLAPEAVASGIFGILRKVDHSFGRFGRSGFRAIKRDGYLVDLITAVAADPMRTSPSVRIGSAPGDLEAIEIEGLVWLINGPKVSTTVIDARGYPLAMHVPDPRVRPSQDLAERAHRPRSGEASARPGAGGTGRRTRPIAPAASRLRCVGTERSTPCAPPSGADPGLGISDAATERTASGARLVRQCGGFGGDRTVPPTALALFVPHRPASSGDQVGSEA